MTKKISHFLLCTFLILASGLVMADRRDEPYNVIINGISMTRGVASRIFNDAKIHNVDIYDKNGNEVDEVAKGVVVTIKSTLMDIIDEAYLDITTNNHENDDYIKKELRGMVVIVAVKKGEKTVEDYIIK